MASANTLENLRNIYMFAVAAEKGDEYPGSRAVVAPTYCYLCARLSSLGFVRIWHWNLSPCRWQPILARG